MAAFIEIEDLNAVLRLDLDDDDALAVLVLDAASEIVRAYTNQELDLSENDEVMLDGSGTTVVLLPQLPVVTVDSVYEDDTDGSSSALLTVDTDYKVGSNGILFRLAGATWKRGRENITITYDHGYSTIPSDVRFIAVNVAARLYDHAGVTAETTGSYVATFESASAGLTEGEKAVLDAYRVRRTV